MQIIPIRAIPNQSLSVTIDRQRWDITIKTAVTSMIVDLVLNDAVLVLGLRIMPNQPLIPYRYLSTAGNFMLLTVDDQLPNWERFEMDQQLVYASASELAAP